MAADVQTIALAAVQLARLWAEFEKTTPNLTPEERAALWAGTSARVKAADEIWRAAGVL